MPLDPNILLQAKPVEVPNALAGYVQALQAQGLQSQNALAGVHMQAAQRDFADQDRIRAALSGLGPTATTQDRVNALYGSGSPAGLGLANTMQLQGADIAAKQARAGRDTSTASKNQQEMQLKAVEMHGQGLSGIDPNDPSAPQQLQAWIRAGYADPNTGAIYQSRAPLEQALQRVPTDPAKIAQYIQQQALGLGNYIKANAPKTSIANTGGATQIIQTPGLGGAPTIAGTLANSVSPSAALSANVAMRAQNMTDARAREMNGILGDSATVGGVGGISSAAIDNAAARYNVDGTLPPMGMGASGALGRKTILNRAAELAGTTTGTDQRVNQLDAKAASSALTQLSKQQSAIQAFERTAVANADLALGMSDKLDRTGVPIINAALQFARTGTGSPEAAQFHAANQTFVNEYAKVMSGGSGGGPTSDAARAKANSLLTTAQTKEQYAGVIGTLKTEMDYRLMGFDELAATLKGWIGGGSASTGTPKPAAGTPPNIQSLLDKYK